MNIRDRIERGRESEKLPCYVWKKEGNTPNHLASIMVEGLYLAKNRCLLYTCQMDVQMDEWMDRWENGQVGRWTNG